MAELFQASRTMVVPGAGIRQCRTPDDPLLHQQCVAVSSCDQSLLALVGHAGKQRGAWPDATCRYVLLAMVVRRAACCCLVIFDARMGFAPHVAISFAWRAARRLCLAGLRAAAVHPAKSCVTASPRRLRHLGACPAARADHRLF